MAVKAMNFDMVILLMKRNEVNGYGFTCGRA